ncbi:MAG: HAMP domain-containing histidine kinase [Actinomycetia bacterium]|nr:HAMP domain-containing histidine kinase [Actinomycetes bacterium]MCP4227145.1 HAMP domain-containing histidine kinase [Actinomycetes bacterium]MCP5030639.1 HAMP domain-containing histidine kinase [Actinomycetes bacterium]
MSRPRPLEGISSIKLKWSIVILAAVGVTAAMSQIGFLLGWPVWLRPLLSAALALIAVQFLAHGMTYPLREMAKGAQEMSRGDYRRRVDVATTDEVGQLAVAFNRMAAELAEVDRSRKEFVANASHELRTPVAALSSQVENLVDRVSEPDPETLATVMAQVDHLAKLVSQLLDLSRLERAPDEGRDQLVAVGLLLKQVVEEAMLLHPGSTITLQTFGPLGLVGDEVRLHQLFTNIIGNALRFAPLGSEVLVEAASIDDNVEIKIRDHGPGIAPQDQVRVFERFWQADGSAVTGGGGAGLGLAISKLIVDRHQGSIEISANQPTGACVMVRLPSRSPN